MRLAANKKRRETIRFSQRWADRCHASSYILLWVMEFTHFYRLSARFSMKIQLIGRHKNARPLSINRDVSSHFFAIFNLQAPFSSFRNGSQKLSANAYIYQQGCQRQSRKLGIARRIILSIISIDSLSRKCILPAGSVYVIRFPMLLYARIQQKNKKIVVSCHFWVQVMRLIYYP